MGKRAQRRRETKKSEKANSHQDAAKSDRSPGLGSEKTARPIDGQDSVDLSAKDMDVLRACRLALLEVDRRNDYLCLRQGQLEEIDTSEVEKKVLPAIYVRREHKHELLRLICKAEIELKKNRVYGASNLLAEAVIAICLAYIQISHEVLIEHIISEWIEVDSLVFIGVPFMEVIMSDPANFLGGVRVGRFRLGGMAEAVHQKCFGKQDSVVRKKQESRGVKGIGAWIMREPMTCRVLKAAFDKRLPQDVLELYRGHLISNLAIEFKSDFESDLQIPTALGAASIDCDVLFSLDGLAIDVSFGKLGQSSYRATKFGAGRSLPENLGELDEKDSISRKLIGDKPIGLCPDIDRLLATYSRFLLRARSHESSNRPSDAFIHMVFALDLVLGGKQESTKNTSRRAAAIFAGATETPFKVAEKEVRMLFDARSKYVHEGKEVPESKFNLLIQICGLVTECLLLSRHATLAEHERYVTEYWYPRLDLIVAAMDAGVDLSDGEFYKVCGIKQVANDVASVLH